MFYRTNRTYIADGLLPRNQSQALHPLPYPDDKNRELQIYYAWWNGVLLGYPERFVDTYCYDFHNELSKPERLIQMRKAKEDFEVYMTGIDKHIEAIGAGLEPPVSDAAWSVIASHL